MIDPKLPKPGLWIPLILLFSLAAACLPGLPIPSPQSARPSTEIAVPASPSSAPDTLPNWLQVYFTNPGEVSQIENGIDQVVVKAIERASQTIDVASFDFNLPSITNALVEAANRGVQVRVVLDETNGSHDLKASESPGGKSFNALKTLNRANIRIVDGGREDGLMHNKMIIIDGSTLFVGSWNMSYNDTFRNDNNLLEITDPRLIENYQARFDEMYLEKRFGAMAEVGARQPELVLDGISVENYFSPPDHVMDKLVALVKAARSSIRFMIFTYTDDRLADAMIERFNAGVKVEGIYENRQAPYGTFPELYCAKLPVKTDGNRYTMHHKVIILDDKTVITGSFNFTVAADKSNDDNLLVIHDPAVARLYVQEFERVYGMGSFPASVDIDCIDPK